MSKHLKDKVSQIAAHFNINGIGSNWTGVDEIMPLIEMIRKDGAVFIVKIDGERDPVEDSGPYSVMAFGKPVGDMPINVDAYNLDDGLAYVIVKYAESVWGLSYS